MKIRQLDIRTGEQWENYYTIITSDAGAVESFLSDQNLSDYLSLNRSFVSYNGISSMKTVPLKEIADHFDAFDPRLDPYMKKVADLFYGQSGNEKYHLIYLKRDSISLFSLYFLLHKNLSRSNTEWRISGFKPLNVYLPLILYSLFLLISPLLIRENKFKNLVALTGWIPFVFLFGIPAVATALGLSSFFYRKKSYLYMAAVTVLLFIYAFYSSILWGIFYLTFITGLIGNFYFLFSQPRKSSGQKAVIPSWRWNRSKIRFGKPDHDLFSPVRIMMPETKKAIAEKLNPSLLSLTVLFLVLVMVLSAFIKKEEPVLLPFMEESKNLLWTLDDLSKTASKVPGEGTFTLSPADYITHVAYQEGFLYGTDWVYPDPDSPLLYPVFNPEGKGFSKSYEILADYSGKWYKDRFSVLNNDNPASLLFSTKRPGTVIKKVNHYKYQSFMLLKISFSMLILLLLIFSNEKKYDNISFSVKNKLLRRNEQVA